MKGRLSIVLAAALMALAAGGCSSKGSNGTPTTSVDPCVYITPLPTSATPSPDSDQLACLIGSVSHQISVDTATNKAGQLVLKYWLECQADLVTWQAWTKGHDKLWFDDHQLNSNPGDCGSRPAK